MNTTTFRPRVRCEGSGVAGHVIRHLHGHEVMCPMCGRYPGHDPSSDLVAEHDRDDIIAMLERGVTATLSTDRGGGVSATPDEARLPASARPLAARVETGNFAADCQRLAEQIGGGETFECQRCPDAGHGFRADCKG